MKPGDRFGGFVDSGTDRYGRKSTITYTPDGTIGIVDDSPSLELDAFYTFCVLHRTMNGVAYVVKAEGLRNPLNVEIDKTPS